MEGQKTVGEWDSYISNFLKANDVTGEDQPFVVISAEEVDNHDGKNIRLHLEIDPIKYILDLNKTNVVFLKNNGIEHPKDVIGKKLFFKIVETRNPKTNQTVDGLRICKIE